MASEKGFGLPSVLASSAITGVLLLAMAGSSNVFTRSIGSIEMRGSLEDLRNLIRTELHCEATITDPESNCLPGEGGFVEGRRGNNSTLFEGTPLTETPGDWPSGFLGTQFGNLKYGVRGKCIDEEDYYRLKIEYYRERKNPLTGRVREWEDLFGGIPWECPKA